MHVYVLILIKMFSVIVSFFFIHSRNGYFQYGALHLFSACKADEHMVEMAIFNVQRAITPKVGKPESQYMCSASCLILLYICLKFCKSIEQTRVHCRNSYFQYLLCSKRADRST